MESKDRDTKWLLIVERTTEIPLMILSLVMIPLLIGPVLWDLPEDTERTYIYLDLIIWAIFLGDMCLKIYLSNAKISYMKANWLELLAVIVPWFRPLRILRLILFTIKGYRGLVRAGRPDYLLVYAVALVVISSTLVTTLEQDTSSNLTTFSDALWWSIVTITTVGYGDITPESPAGRVIAIVLMLGGIGLFGALTANLASMFTKHEDSTTTQIEELIEEVRSLKSEFIKSQHSGTKGDNL